MFKSCVLGLYWGVKLDIKMNNFSSVKRHYGSD